MVFEGFLNIGDLIFMFFGSKTWKNRSRAMIFDIFFHKNSMILIKSKRKTTDKVIPKPSKRAPELKSDVRPGLTFLQRSGPDPRGGVGEGLSLPKDWGLGII